MNDERFTEVSIDIDLSSPEIQSVLTGNSSNCVSVARTYNTNLSLAGSPASYKFNDYMTTELNYNILDDSLKIANFSPNTARSSDIVWMSVKSGIGVDDKTEWSEEHNSSLVLNIGETADGQKDFAGFMLYFIGDYPKEISVVYQEIDSSSQVVINEYEKTVEVASPTINIIFGAFKISRIIITPKYSHIPDRCAKIYYVKVGLDVAFGDTDLKSATLVQETNLVGDMLSLNTLNFEIIDNENNFNYGNSGRIIDFFKRLTPVVPKVTVDDTEITLGKYYIDKIESNVNLAKISTFSILGIMDTIPFNDGTIYSNTSVGTILAKVFSVAGITNYSIDPVISAVTVTGTLPPCTCRQALQKLMFVARGIVITNDPQYQIRIVPIFITRGLTIKRDEKISTQVKDADYITGIELSYNTYTLVNTDETIVEQATYAPGVHTIVFSNPYSADSTLRLSYASGSAQATITKRSTFYITFRTPANTSVTCSIIGRKYESKSKTLTLDRSYIEAGRQKNVKSYSTTLCDYIQASNLIADILGYFETNNMEIKIKQFSKDASMLYRQVIQNEIEDLDDYVGLYVSRTFNLTGGFIDDAKLVGYYRSAQAFSVYATPASYITDVYAGDKLLR